MITKKKVYLGVKGDNFMWLEVKAMMTGMGIIFIILGIALNSPMLLAVLLLFGIGMLLFGDILIGFLITSNECKPLIDKTPPGYELTIFQELGGGGKIHFINTKKSTLGQRKFRFHNKEAIAITDGRGMGTTPNGNRFFFSHESYDKNIDPGKCKAYSKLPGENIKDTYNIIMEEYKNEG